MKKLLVSKNSLKIDTKTGKMELDFAFFLRYNKLNGY